MVVAVGGSVISCRPPEDQSEHVQLVLNTPTLEPTTTFEVRFEEPMVDAAAVGGRVDPSPLVMSPPLPGEFRWLSTRSGVFTPSAPPALGTGYEVTLRPGLRTADGQTSRARLDRFFQTPGLEVIQPSRAPRPQADAAAEVVYRVCFNTEIAVDRAGRHFSFRDSEGHVVGATVRPLSTNEVWSYRRYGRIGEHAGGLPLTWQERFRSGTSGTDAEPEAGCGHCVMVSTARPLVPGKGWGLVIQEGLPSRDGRLRLRQAVRLPVGDVLPFEVRAIEAHSGLEGERTLVVRFSKGLSDGVTSTNAAEWIRIEPAPGRMMAQRRWRELVFSGDFRLGTDYRVAVRSGVPGPSGFVLDREHEATVQYAPLPARLRLTEFAGEQYAAGHREFPIWSVNCDKVLVRAKRLDAGSLVHALRGYRSYDDVAPEAARAGEPHAGLDYNVVPGWTAWAKEFTPGAAKDVGEVTVLRWDEILGKGVAGPVFVCAESVQDPGHGAARVGVQALMQVTDLGVAWKRAGDWAWVFLFGYESGQPVGGATLRVVSSENRVVSEGKTDAAGLARLATLGDGEWLVVETGSDLRALELSRVNLWPHQFGVAYGDGYGETLGAVEVFPFTDRAVYRPGEVVHFEAILRERVDGRLGRPDLAAMALRCYNARDQRVFETNLTLTASGSVAHSFRLPSAGRGSHRLALVLGENEVSHAFEVQDYRPNAFEVDLTGPAAFRAGEATSVGVRARYLSGQELSRATVRWWLTGGDAAFAPDGLEAFAFGMAGGSPALGMMPASFSAEGEGVLEGGTNALVLAFEVPVHPKVPQPRACELVAEVTDLNQQTVLERKAFVRHASEFYLGIQRPVSPIHAGERTSWAVVAVRADEQALGETVPVSLTLNRVVYNTVRPALAGGVIGFQSDAELDPVARLEGTSQTLVRVGTGWEVKPGPEAFPVFVVPEPGEYLLEARARDGAGRDVVTVLSFAALGAGEMAWDYRNEAQLDLVPDAERHRAGETATLLVKSPFDGQAWVTVEQEAVRRMFVTNLVGNAPAIVVPLAPEDAPNVHVSVLLVRGAGGNPHTPKVPEYRYGYCRLTVDRADSRLDVAVRPAEAEYRPRENVRVVVEVRDHLRSPVSDAEVTVFAVDEGVLGLTGFTTPDPWGLFYRPRATEVTSGITLPFLMAEDPAQFSYQNKGYVAGGGGRAAARQKFMACAHWASSLRTDVKGRVETAFEAPDNLTRYRIMAVAHAGTDRFGNGAAPITIHKPLMIEPSMPEFARVGDRLVARAVVLNRTDASVKADVTLETDGKVTVAGLAGADRRKAVALAPGESRAVDYPVEAVLTGVSEWLWRAEAQAAEGSAAGSSAPGVLGLGDAVRSTLRIDHPGPLLREVRAFRFDGGDTNLLAGVDPQILEGTGTVALVLAPSLLVQAGEAASQLLHYPYGCVEQTASSLLPWVLLRQAPAALRGHRSLEEMDRAIEAGVSRIFSMQAESGGLAYWPGGGEAEFWASGYGAVVLSQVRERGVAVPEGPYTALLDYLSGQLRLRGKVGVGFSVDGSCLAVCALALAGRAEPAYHEGLFTRRGELSATGCGWLAAAMALSGGEGSGSHVDELLSLAERAADRESGDYTGPDTAWAVALWAGTLRRPPHGGGAAAAAQLMRGMQGGHWGTTQGNAWGLLALSGHERAAEGSRRGARLLNLVAGGESRVIPLGPDDVYEHAMTLREAQGVVRLLDNPRGPVYGQVTIESQPLVWQQPRQDRGFVLHRRYDRLSETNQPVATARWRVGDRVLVTLTLEARQRGRFVAVDDPLPAVFEPVRPEFRTQGAVGQATLAADWVSSHRELRADRALFFCDHLPAGLHEIRYLARVRCAGTVRVPGAKAEEMYHPERLGLTESGEVEVDP